MHVGKVMHQNVWWVTCYHTSHASADRQELHYSALHNNLQVAISRLVGSVIVQLDRVTDDVVAGLQFECASFAPSSLNTLFETPGNDERAKLMIKESGHALRCAGDGLSSRLERAG
jgi:hypothetical protein